MQFVDVSQVLDDQDCEAIYHLPPHFKCAAHLLNLVACKDVEAALKSASFKRLSRSTFAKCQELWSKQSWSTVTADIIRDKCTTLFVVPIVTRWNSTYDAAENFLQKVEKGPDNLDSLMDGVGLIWFRNSELAFLHEYANMCLVSHALDILQGEKNVYLDISFLQYLQFKASLTHIKITFNIVDHWLKVSWLA